MSAVLLALLAAVGFSGASLLALFGKGLGARGRSLAAAFAAGILLALTFVELFPEALELAGRTATVGFVAGFAVLFLVENVFRAHTDHGPEEPVHEHAVGPFVAGLAVHNLADGFAIGIGAEAPEVTSWLVGLGILVHQVPVGVSLAAVLVAARATRARVMRSAIALGLAIPFAAFLVLALPAPGESTLGLLTGAAGGVLAYVGAAHLLPEARAEHRGRGTGILFLATLLATTFALLTLF
ncbi:hypothetical protein GBA63_08595 [Rubrobacter tropicus]|uniref:ZIP family metal transporter n=1 Tax=Rubrobacter tropicus TaxID=2653851 RepID=A0A6G8Q884_9ACTN|nr:ZIP family metal transporter [Rubrobacter tropicus]QIN82695.1 hypothetical protein GBA63_08595 [Rubrobacter tropicus]